MKQILSLTALALVGSAFAQSVYRVELKADGATLEHREFPAPDANLADGFAATYHLPKTIPGTYATPDYGRFVTDFAAIDGDGKALKVKKLGNNSQVDRLWSTVPIVYAVYAAWFTGWDPRATLMAGLVGLWGATRITPASSPSGPRFTSSRVSQPANG